MNTRHAYALTHPITSPDPSTTDIAAYRYIDQQPDGNQLISVLAIDR